MATKKTEKSGRGRPRTGSLYETKAGWCARVTVQIDGVNVQKRYVLGTADRAAAKAKLRKLLKEKAPPTKEAAAAALTIADFCEQWLARREAQNVSSVDYERRYMERIWLPRIGSLSFDRVSVADIQEILDAAILGKLMPAPRKGRKTAPKPYGRQSVIHIRNTIVGLFRSAERNELCTRNVAALTETPPEPDNDQLHKVRATITDAELAQLLACPIVDAEIKMVVLVSRTVGGLRSGDVNAMDWTQFSPGFETLSFVRRKTKKKRPAQEIHAVPEVVRPFVAGVARAVRFSSDWPCFPRAKGPPSGAHQDGIEHFVCRTASGRVDPRWHHPPRAAPRDGNHDADGLPFS